MGCFFICLFAFCFVFCLESQNGMKKKFVSNSYIKHALNYNASMLEQVPLKHCDWTVFVSVTYWSRDWDPDILNVIL